MSLTFNRPPLPSDEKQWLAESVPVHLRYAKSITPAALSSCLVITHRISRAGLYQAIGSVSILLVALGCALSGHANGQAGSNPKPRIDSGLAFAMHADRDQRIMLPRLTTFPDANVRQLVNADLDSEAARLRDEAQRCDTAGNGKSDWEQTARVDLLTRDAMSIDVQVSYFCGGPHPDEEYSPLTYNLRTGKRFDFANDAEELFFGDAIPAGELIALYRKHLGTPGPDFDPSFIDPETHLFLHFTAEGLAITPEVPHFAAAWAPQIVIPYREIRPLVKPQNPFHLLFTKTTP